MNHNLRTAVLGRKLWILPGTKRPASDPESKGVRGTGYTQAVLVDLSKYFDTLNHELLMNLLRKHFHDKREKELIKRYPKSGVIENGIHAKTEEGSPQGGPLSPLLASVYSNEPRNGETGSSGDSICRVHAKSKRAVEQPLESGRKYLEGKLKLKMNGKKSKAVSVLTVRKFKLLGFTLGRDEDRVCVRPHVKSLEKAKAERTDFPQSEQKCPSGDGECNEIHLRMAWLLRSCKCEENNAELGRMAAPQVSNVYLETAEDP